ncbi:MAG: histidine phosphatase family protein [Ilumatobacteraceae bacterium]
MTRLVLVRHGESNVTVNRIIGGPRTCNGLSDLGRRQATNLRDRWAANREFEPDVLIASQYPRAFETMQIVAPAFGTELPIVRDAGFGEHDPGPDCDGLSYKEFVERYPELTGRWDDHDPFATTFPGGETVAAFQYRVGTAVRRVLDEHKDKTVVIACHGGVVDAVLRLALKAPAMGGFEIHTVNTSITELVQVRSSTWRLVRYNDSAHLAGLPAHTNES